MATSKEFVIYSEEQELRCFVNGSNLISIFVGEIGDVYGTQTQVICVDKGDLLELIEELHRLSKEI